MPSVAEAVVRDANTRLAGHQQIRDWSVWPEEDFPRTPSMKVKKRLVLDGTRAWRRRGTRGQRPADGCRLAALAARRRAVATVAELVAQVAQVPPAQVAPSSRLETDLGLDSLGRIELLSVIEEELGAFVDDGQLDPDATVTSSKRLVEGAGETRHDEGVFGWPLNPMVRAVGLGNPGAAAAASRVSRLSTCASVGSIT